MDSRKTTQGDGDERTTENVVRLPRDWLGPREELVPIGSRARAAETPDDAPPESLPPTAASFWDEDSGSLQAPMQAPADTWQGRWEPASPGQAGPARSTPSRLRRIPRLRRPRSLGGGFAPRGRRGVAAVAGVLGACILVVLAVIGETAGGTHNHGGKTAAVSKSAAIVTATGVNRARLRAHTPVVTEIRTEPASHHAGRAGARRHRTHVSARRRPRAAPRPTPSASQPVRSTTPAYTPTPTPSTPSSGSTSSSPPASSARSTSSSSQHQPAFGQSGSLGPGSSPDG